MTAWLDNAPASADALLDEDADAFEELDELSDNFETDGLDDAWDELDAADEMADGFADELDADASDDEFADGFEMDEASGLYLPQAPQLVSGPAAMAIANRLNPFVLDAMDADEADAFLRRVRRAMRRVGSVAGRVGRIAGRAARVAAPLLRRALPMVQRVAGLAGPWGRVISAGIGAARGLMKGRGLRGALAGAVGGLIPGIGGQIASRVLGGDGADDDAALDALADMADTGQVAPAVALPLGAGLAARVATPRTASGAWPPALRRQAQATEQVMLRAARQATGNAGRRLRILRAIARLAREYAAARRAAGRPVTPVVALAAARRILFQTRRRPSAGQSSRASAAARLRLRYQILRQLPAAALSTPRAVA